MLNQIKILCPYCYSSELLMYPQGMNSSSAGILQMPSGNINDNNMQVKCTSCSRLFKTGEGKLSSEADSVRPFDPLAPVIKSLNPDELYIYDLCRRTDKFTAVKYCVTTYGWSLESSRNYVDEILDRVARNIIKPPSSGNDKYEDEVIGIIQSQGKLPAIKFIRERTGLGLKESKDYVDRVVAENNIVLKKEGCFIATACYGSYHAPEVLVLRSYRDKVLQLTLAGRAFIYLYYAFSPPLARLISRSDKGKTLVRKYFVAPLVRFIERIK